MGKLKDKVVGKTKQAVAEIIGDGKLNEDGKEQARTIEPTNSEPPGKPLGNLDKLTWPTLAANGRWNVTVRALGLKGSKNR